MDVIESHVSLFPSLRVTLARRTERVAFITSCRRSLSFRLLHNTFESTCKHSSTLQQYQTSFQLIDYQFHTLNTTNMVASKVLVAAAMVCVAAAHDYDSE
jgi:hypothetical protein